MKPGDEPKCMYSLVEEGQSRCQLSMSEKTDGNCANFCLVLSKRLFLYHWPLEVTVLPRYTLVFMSFI